MLLSFYLTMGRQLKKELDHLVSVYKLTLGVEKILMPPDPGRPMWLCP